MNNATVENAVALHGHLSPGIAIGLRMSEIAMQQLKMTKGNKALVAVSETNRCLPDAIQVATGCTLGHSSIILANYGKLALTLADTTTKEGIRVALNENAKNHSLLMKNWMLRLGKLTKEEEHDLGNQLLDLEEKYFSIQKIRIEKLQANFIESSRISLCSKCNEFCPSDLANTVNDKVYCKSCQSESYYTLQ